MSWFKQTLANVAGTQEPIYGPSAIQTVTEQTKETPYTETTADDLKWHAAGGTCVETQTFYFQTDDGKVCMAQVIYSSVMGVRTTCQFNTKIFDHDGLGRHQWLADGLNNHRIDEKRTGFHAANLTVDLDAEGTMYRVSSQVNNENLVDFTIKRECPGFVAGENGTSFYGTDPNNPWGQMRHAFWPRCSVTGTMKTKTKEYNLAGRGVFIHALQGYKPHHLAARWNFVNIQTPTYSAIMMEFTTPPSYGKTTVNVGCIARDGEIVIAGGGCDIKHLAAVPDSVSNWPEPKAIMATWSGKTKTGEAVTAELTGDLGDRADRVDVLAHVPGVVKNIIGGVAGTKPIIFQYIGDGKMHLKIVEGGKETSESGRFFSEATFIS